MRCLIVAALLLLVSACATLPNPPIPEPPDTGSQFVAFDIDGTLTPHNLLVSQPRPDAASAVRAFESKGYAIVYITTRVAGLQASLPSWLERNGFPPGTLHVAQSSRDRENAADFKLRVLNSYIERGWRLSYAFGDSPTDFAAYQGAGLPRERVFALKRMGRSTCEEGVYGACLDGWSEYLEAIDAAPTVGRGLP
jgi:phosphatidate phosphatase PAH1